MCKLTSGLHFWNEIDVSTLPVLQQPMPQQKHGVHHTCVQHTRKDKSVC